VTKYLDNILVSNRKHAIFLHVYFCIYVNISKHWVNRRISLCIRIHVYIMNIHVYYNVTDFFTNATFKSPVSYLLLFS
jgi:hypothetical protein